MEPNFFKKRLSFAAIVFLCCTLFFVTFTRAELQERIIHVPVNSAIEGQDVVLEAKVEGSFARVVYVRIYFQNQEEESFRYVEMRQEVDNWVGHIPARGISGSTVRYFLAALLDNQAILTYPEINPYNDPEEISISPLPAAKSAQPPTIELPGQQPQEPLRSSDETALPAFTEQATEESPDLLLLSPETGEKLTREDLVIAVSLIGSERVIDSSTVALFIDGHEVTAGTEISSYLVTFTPPRIRAGRHWIKVTAKDASGAQVPALLSHFYVLGEQETSRPYTRINGRVFADLRQEKFNGKSRATNFAGGDFSGEYGALRFSGRAFLSSLEQKDRQPINRFTLNLQTKWIGMRLGDTNPRYNDLILWGKRVRGIEGYVRLGFFNLDVVYGETYRGVEGITTTTLDTLTNQTTVNVRRYGTFRQTLLGIRPSFGSGRHFQFGLSLVKVKDDISSIDHGTMPKDNLVIGPDFILRFDRRRFEFRANAAFSALTNNIYPGPISKDEIEGMFDSDTKVEIPFDPEDFEKYLILNDSTIPLDPSKMTSAAYNVSVRLNYFHNLFRIGYKSIGSEYNALSNSFIRKDIQGLYFSDRLRLFRNQLYFTIRYEDFNDNFSQDDNNPVTDLRTLNYALSFYPGHGLPNLNISLRNRYRDNGISAVSVDSVYAYGTGQLDTTITNDRRENIKNRDLSVQLSQDFSVFSASHSLSLNFVNSDRIDEYNNERPDSLSRNVSTYVRMVSFRSSFEIPLVTTIQYASNANNSVGGLADFQYNMFGLTGEYRLFKQKLTTYAELRLTTASGNTIYSEKIDYTKNTFRFGCMFRFSPMHTISLDSYIIAFKDNGVNAAGVANDSHTDTIFRLRYEKRF